MTNRQKQATQSREALIAAAMKLITEKGYEKTTIADIARACSMSIGNFYHYFKSKDELITILEREGYSQKLRDTLKLESVETVERLRLYMENWFDLSINYFGHNFDRQWFIYHMSNPTELDDPENKINVAAGEISLIIKKGVECGELDADTPVDVLAKDIAFMIIGAECYVTMTSGRFDEAAWGKHLCAETIPMFLAPYKNAQKSV